MDLIDAIEEVYYNQREVAIGGSCKIRDVALCRGKEP